MHLDRISNCPLLLRDCEVHHHREIRSCSQQVRGITLELALQLPAELGCFHIKVHVHACLAEEVGKFDDDLDVSENSLELRPKSSSVLRERELDMCYYRYSQ